MFFFGLTWFFPQLRQQYNLTGMQASLFAAVPMVFGALGNWFSGWWVDSLYRRNRWAPSRRIPATAGFILAAGRLGHDEHGWQRRGVCHITRISVFVELDRFLDAVFYIASGMNLMAVMMWLTIDPTVALKDQT